MATRLPKRATVPVKTVQRVWGAKGSILSRAGYIIPGQRMRARLLACLAATVTALTGGVSAQVPTIDSLRTGTASISGRVVNAETGEALGNVSVNLTAPRIMGVLPASTDTGGFYRFDNLAEHDYNVHVGDPLYLRACYGATDAAQFACGPIALVRDQHRTGIDLRVALAAVVTGRVVDQYGRAVEGANVMAGPGPSMPSSPYDSGTRTKGDGSFEIQGLPTGDTVLSLDMPITADAPRPPTVYYPGVFAHRDAEAIRVTGGLVTSGITFRYPKVANRALTVRVSTAAHDAGPTKAWLYRIEPRMTRQIALDAEGMGRVPGLLEGRYFVAAYAQDDKQMLAAFEIVQLIDDEVELPLLLQDPGRISGKLVAERGGVPPLSGVRIAASWTDDGEVIDPVAADDVEVAPDGGFRIDGLFGMRTVRVLGLPPEWKVLSIRQGRSEVSPAGVVVPAGATLDLVVTVGLR